MSVWIDLAFSAPVLTVCKCSMWSVKGKGAFLIQFLVLSGGNYYWQNHCHLNLLILPSSKTECLLLRDKWETKVTRLLLNILKRLESEPASWQHGDQDRARETDSSYRAAQKNHPMLLCLTCKLVVKSLELRLISVYFIENRCNVFLQSVQTNENTLWKFFFFFKEFVQFYWAWKWIFDVFNFILQHGLNSLRQAFLSFL